MAIICRQAVASDRLGTHFVSPSYTKAKPPPKKHNSLFLPVQDRFRQLPPELRLVIWNLTQPNARIVTIRCGPTSPTHGRASQSIQCTSPTPVPVTLHVCRESRIEAQGRYKLLFGLLGNPGTIYLDPSRDTLYFGVRDGFAHSEAHLHTFMGMISAPDRARVRHLAVNNELLLRQLHERWWDPAVRGPTPPTASRG